MEFNFEGWRVRPGEGKESSGWSKMLIFFKKIEYNVIKRVMCKTYNWIFVANGQIGMIVYFN